LEDILFKFFGTRVKWSHAYFHLRRHLYLVESIDPQDFLGDIYITDYVHAEGGDSDLPGISIDRKDFEVQLFKDQIHSICTEF